jgi:hypothetical protein
VTLFLTLLSALLVRDVFLGVASHFARVRAASQFKRDCEDLTARMNEALRSQESSAFSHPDSVRRYRERADAN